VKRHPYRIASEDEPTADRFGQIFAPNIVFRSPVAADPVQGVEVVRTIQELAHRVFGRPAYRFECREGSNTVLLFDARVDGEVLQAAVMIRDDDEDRVAELAVMMRPLSVVRTFSAIMESRLGLNLDL
jgi:hypothetical protein